ncbi:hypothetical protein [Marinobacter sp. BGYM27]|uniref:hypothetical protein n=1 Tax=Marinobacter sp. BGYM27 TaxID=2975597 RepID=UPI0021A65E62|nr:hypothetical protein [Marinobacter sp. BGYM27]MDG5500346.1 hypothetical protein [Marinobacter sp. BGYM27]
MKTPAIATLLCLSALLSGCTNVTGDTPRMISYTDQKTLSKDALFTVANGFFSRAGYECDDQGGSVQLLCNKELRDLYIHQTTAEVTISQGTGEEKDPDYVLATSRWDEGMIPSELLSSHFSNRDVQAFCDYLEQETQAVCREL